MSACPHCGPASRHAVQAKRAGVELRVGQSWRGAYWSDGKGQAIRCAPCDGTGQIEIDELEEESSQRERDEWISLGRDE